MNRRDLIVGAVSATAAAAVLPASAATPPATAASLGPMVGPPWAQALRDEWIRKIALIKNVVMVGDTPTERFYMQIWYETGVSECLDGVHHIYEAIARIRNQDRSEDKASSKEFAEDAFQAIKSVYG